MNTPINLRPLPPEMLERIDRRMPYAIPLIVIGLISLILCGIGAVVGVTWALHVIDKQMMTE